MIYGLSHDTALKAKARWGVYAGGFFGGFGGYQHILQDPVLNDIFGRELEHPDFRKAKKRWEIYKEAPTEPADILMDERLNNFFRGLYEAE